MSPLEVVFEVPKHILSGLLSGQLERVGGVIRNSATKEVVVWLRDANVLDSVGGILPTPLNLILNAARAALSLYDGHLTRTAIGELSEQVDQLSHQLKWVTSMSTFVVGGQVLNLGLTAISLYATLQKLNQLSDEISHLSEMIRAQFNWDRNLRFKTALQAARDVFETDESNFRNNAVRSAIDGLYEARENFLDDYNETMKRGDPTLDNLLMAKHYLIRAIYAETSRIRCYLASGEIDIARRYLKEDLVIFKEASTRLVDQFIGKKPALYFYKDVDASDLDRFLQIQRWLKSPDDVSGKEALTLFDVINQLRGDFWNQTIVQEEYDNPIGRLINRPSNTVATQVSKIPQQLSNAEIMIENYQRLLGFDLELRSIRLSLDNFTFDEWNKYTLKDDPQQHRFAMVIDRDQLDQVQAS